MTIFSIRHLHLALLIYAITLSVGTGAWILFSLKADWSETAWMVHVDRLGDRILQAGVEAATERGLGVIVLTGGGSDEVQARLATARSEAQRLYREVIELARELPNIWHGEPPPKGHRVLRERIASLQENEAAVERARAGLRSAIQGGDSEPVTPESWFNTLSRYNDALQEVLFIASATPAWVPMPFSDCISAKGHLFTVLEYAGRERGIIAGVLAEGRALQDEERNTLLSHRAVLTETLRQLRSSLKWLPTDDRVDGSLTAIREIYFDRYTPLFESVLRRVGKGRNPPAAAEFWFREATAGIEPLFALRDSLGSVVDREVQEAREELLFTASLRALAVGVLTFLPLVVGVIVRRRVVGRLGVLVATADSLRQGDLGSPVRLSGEDELTELAETLEAMRCQLRAEMRQLQAKEQALEQQTDSLRQANRDLQQFAYVVAHDLKAPLRAVHGLSSWIEEDVEPYLGPDGRKRLELLRQRVQRMDAMIEALLQYASAGKQGAQPEWVDTRELLCDILLGIPPPAEFVVDIGPEMPRLYTVRQPLRQVFSNLVENAFTHHDRPEQGHLRIHAEPLGSMYCFSLTDDGPGIPPAYHEQIFSLFQRLDNRDGGTGMGLALVRKLVDGVGGEVEVESSGRGATFRFTWPSPSPGNPAVLQTPD